MKSRNLKKIVKSVRGKKSTIKRSYWVSEVGSKFAKAALRHKGKIALGGAALVGGLKVYRTINKPHQTSETSNQGSFSFKPHESAKAWHQTPSFDRNYAKHVVSHFADLRKFRSEDASNRADYSRYSGHVSNRRPLQLRASMSPRESLDDLLEELSRKKRRG